ncbi:hypothetical protein FPCIR_4773 [Fusarium pseudocircinatum]|uniref:BTB domain-containing protein n=1 Tax=Fusarium pseudocircinatum TaxID=56676 RepID=A0A8H5PDP6_9HYPO|nr:hypothetical protein FPCIR_4773 [Fusarium pseudocircinatum]
MEPIGALASVITIVDLIRPTAQFVKALRGIASENGIVASEIHRMATRIQTSATSIDIALEDLKSHSSTLRRISITPSKILQHMIDNKSIQTIVSGTQSISNQMRDKAQELKQLKKQPNLYKKLKWCIWDKMEVESLFPEMQLVAFMLEKSPGEVAQCLRQEMAYLRGQLKMVEKQCRALMQEQQSSINSEFETEFYATAKPLLRLARSVRRTGTVPETRRRSSSRRASASQEIPMSIHREIPPVLDGEGTREIPRRTRRKTSLQSAKDRNFNSAPPSQTPRPSSGVMPTESHGLSVPREAPSEVSRHSSSSGESSRQHSAPQSPSPQTPDTPLTPQSPDAPKSLRVDTSAPKTESRWGAIQAITGCIIDPRDHGKASPEISANTNHCVVLNYISVKTARQFDLEFQELDPNLTHDDRHEEVMPGPVIGKVTGVEWRKTGWAKAIPVEFLVKDCYHGSYLPTSITTLTSHLPTTSPHFPSQRSAASMAAQNAQSEALANLLKTGDYSDLTITCGKDQYRVHKAIICPRSNFFKAACDGKFEEAHTGEVDLPDDDPAAVRMMIEYLYHDTYVPAGAIIHCERVSDIDAHLSDTEYNEQEKGMMELYGATFVGNKRVRRLTAPYMAPIAPTSQLVPAAFGQAAPLPPPPPDASQEPRSGPQHGSFGGVNSPSGWASAQGFLNQSPPTPGPSYFAPPAPGPTLPPAPQPSAPRLSIPFENLHLHAKVYALGEKYGIQPLKALALHKFNSEAHFQLDTDDFLQAIREAYTSTIETDRPLRDAVVTILRRYKHLLKKDSVKAVLKETALGFDLLMELALE